MPATGVLTLMSGVTEDLIERYVGYPETLDEKSRRLVEHTIRIDRSARKVADFYRAYFAELRRSEDPARPSRPSATSGSPRPDTSSSAPDKTE